MSRHEPAVTLRQLDELCAEAQEIVVGHPLATLLADRLRTRAWERVMELIGEAAKRLPVELRARYGAVDWTGAAGMRDWIIHGYDGIDYDILWRATHDKLPGVRATVSAMLVDLEAKKPTGS